MPFVTKEVFINASLEEIYNFVRKPASLLQIWPSLIEMREEKSLDNGGYGFRWKYKMYGITLTGRGECVDNAPNLWLISKTHRALESTHTWTFRSNNHKTKVTLTVDYHLPLRLLNRITEITLIKQNEREVELILENLRNKFEPNPS